MNNGCTCAELVIRRQRVQPPRFHDCAYVRRHNALIVEAERIASEKIAIARTDLDAYGRSCREWNAEFSAAMGELARSKASKRPFVITLSLLCGEQTRHNPQRELPGNRTNTLSGAVRVTRTGRRLSENREGQTNLSLKLLRDFAPH